MMVDLTKLKQVRNGYRLNAKKAINSIKELLENLEPSMEGKLIAYKVTLTEKLEVLQEIDIQVLEKIDDAEAIATEIEEAPDLRVLMKEAIANIELAFKSKQPGPSNPFVGHNQMEETHDNSQASKPAKTVKLPKLHLQKFSGCPSEFRTFWDSFQAAVDSNTDINDVEKMNYLRGLLNGPAAAIIAGLALSSANYTVAVKLLHERFGNRQLVINSHMESLLKLSCVSSMVDIKKIRMVYDMIESNVRSLQNLGISAEMYGSLLIPMMLAKIPKELKLIISRDMKGETWDSEQLSAIFKSELEAREKIQSMSDSSSMSHVEGKFNRKNPVTAAALFVSDKTAVSCVYCKQQHRSNKCQVVTNVASRRGILHKKGVCFVCLCSGHIARNCL